MTIALHEFRLSLLWVEIQTELLEEPQAAHDGLADLGGTASYGRRFETVQQRLIGRPDTGLETDPYDSLRPPWLHPRGHLFWMYYLERRMPGDVNGGWAWKHLLPLRAPVPLIVKASWLPAEVSFEAYFYPFGTALMAHITAAPPTEMSCEEAVHLGLQMIREGRMEAHWSGQSSALWAQVPWSVTNPSRVGMTEIAESIVLAMRHAMLGKAASPGYRHAIEPFTILTVLDGTTSLPLDQGLEDGGPVHRTLEAMVRWPTTWENDPLPALDLGRLPAKTGPVSDVLYGHHRGRVVWFPTRFAVMPPRRQSLACYHTNLTCAAMQTESLCTFLLRSVDRLRRRDPMPQAYEHCVRCAVDLVGALYGGGSATYRSWSIRRQIEEEGFIEAINAVRTHLRKQPLYLPTESGNRS